MSTPRIEVEHAWTGQVLRVEVGEGRSLVTVAMDDELNANGYQRVEMWLDAETARKVAEVLVACAKAVSDE